jgi:hypothetical protein
MACPQGKSSSGRGLRIEEYQATVGGASRSSPGCLEGQLKAQVDLCCLEEDEMVDG